MYTLDSLIKDIPIALFKPFAFVQFGPPRSGSTLVYNLLQETFPRKKIFKVHTLRRMCKTLSVVATYRNPFDSIASSLICHGKVNCTKNEIEKEIALFNASGIKSFPDLIKRSNFLCLKYEDFVHDFDYVFDAFELYFKIVISEKQRVFLKNKYEIKNVSKMIENMDSFAEHDKKSRLHGNHISKYEGASYHKEFFSAAQLERLHSEYADVLTALGY